MTVRVCHATTVPFNFNHFRMEDCQQVCVHQFFDILPLSSLQLCLRSGSDHSSSHRLLPTMRGNVDSQV